MSLFLAWLCFPLIMAAVGGGWGLLVEGAVGRPLPKALIIPTGLAALLVVDGTLTAFGPTAPASPYVAALGAALGLGLYLWPRPRLTRDLGVRLLAGRPRLPLPDGFAGAAAVLVILLYGLPILLYGHATFAGYLRLDDTATWLNVADIIVHHGRDWQALPTSTFRLVFSGDVGESYPLGSFVLLGIGHELSGINSAWIFDPFLAICAGAVCLSLYDLFAPLIAARGARALLAAIASLSALLYGYYLWGGIKELVAAFTLALGISWLARAARTRPRDLSPRQLLPLGLAAGALIQTLGIGGGGWAGPAAVGLVVFWLWRFGRAEGRAIGASLAVLAAIIAVSVIPVWAVLATFINHSAGLFSEGQSQAQKYGNLIGPLSPWQLFGVWLSGDFRVAPASFPTGLLIGIGLVGVLYALGRSLLAKEPAIPLLILAALGAVALLYISEATPWVVGKGLAISSIALPAAALAGGLFALLGAGRDRLLAAVGGVVVAATVVGVLWSNFLSSRDATFAPRPRQAELAAIAPLVNEKGPTLISEYEVYADRHFLGDGAPIEPAEYRPYTVPLRNGLALTKAGWAPLDSFTPEIILGYRSLVTRRDPAETRPPTPYRLIYQGAYYDLWQRPVRPVERVIEMVPFGEEATHPYCGNASGVQRPAAPCPLDPVGFPSCKTILGYANRAQEYGAELVAFQRAQPIVVWGDEALYPASWEDEPYGRSLLPSGPGRAVAHIAVPTSQRYAIYLAGNFGGRGLELRIDGRKVGFIANELSEFFTVPKVATLYLTAGQHTFEYVVPNATLAPGSGEFLSLGSDPALDRYTGLMATLLQPLETPREELVRVPPYEASSLCGRPLEALELVRG